MLSGVQTAKECELIKNGSQQKQIQNKIKQLCASSFAKFFYFSLEMNWQKEAKKQKKRKKERKDKK